MFDSLASSQPLRDLQNRLLTHPIHEHVSLAIKQNRAADFVGPIVVMRQSPQRSLDTASDDGHAGIRLAGPMAITQGRPIWPQTNPAARRIRVRSADRFVGRV